MAKATYEQLEQQCIEQAKSLTEHIQLQHKLRLQIKILETEIVALKNEVQLKQTIIKIIEDEQTTSRQQPDRFNWLRRAISNIRDTIRKK